MQSSIIDVIIPDHCIRNFTGILRTVGFFLLQKILKSGNWLEFSSGPGEQVTNVADNKTRLCGQIDLSVSFSLLTKFK